jgi:hypothetical protein
LKNLFYEKEVKIQEKFEENNQLMNIFNTKIIKSEVNVKALWDSFTFFSDTMN